MPLARTAENGGACRALYPFERADKFTRMVLVRLFLSLVWWRPDMNFAEEVVEECASFPNGEHDDFIDDTGYTQVQTGWIYHSPLIDEDDYREFNRKREYY